MERGYLKGNWLCTIETIQEDKPMSLQKDEPTRNKPIHTQDPERA